MVMVLLKSFPIGEQPPGDELIPNPIVHANRHLRAAVNLYGTQCPMIRTEATPLPRTCS